MQIVNGALGTVLKELVKGQEELEIETIQTSALSRSVRIVRRVLETWGNLVLFRVPCESID